MASPAAILSILVKTQGAQAAASQLGGLDKSGRAAAGGLGKAESQAKRSSKSFSAVGTAAKSAGVLLGAAGLAKGISTAVSEYREAQKVGGQTTAVLKSTGSAANVTAKHINNLAGAISKKTGIDDETIQSSENMLLTFTKLRNETGKGNKIFDQATQTVTDMSVALGQSGKSSAIQLGKALNDPIKGITALRRVGVAFTADQQKQITTLENTGHHLEAQKIILRELKTEFAGSAAAQATAGDKFKVSLMNLAEAAGAVIVPAMDKVMGVLTRFFNQMVTGVGVGGALISKFREFGGALAPLGQSIAVIVGWLTKHEGVSRALAIGIGVLTGAVIALNLAMSANPFVLAGVAIAALVVGVVTAYREFATFRNIVDTVVNAVKVALPTIVAVAQGVMATFVAVFRAVWPTIRAIFSGGITAIKAIVVGGAQILSGAVQVIKGVLHGDFTEIWEGIKNIFRGGFTAVRGLVTGAAQGIGTAALNIGTAIIKGILSGLGLLGHAILDKFKEAAKFVVDNVGSFFSGIGGKIKGAIGSINPFGDGPGAQVGKLPSGKGAGNLMGASSALAPFAAIGSRFGLSVSSGRRPGAITTSGNVSYHSSGQAIDEAGPPAGMLKYFQFLKSHYGSRLAELIYTPGGVGIKDGKPFRYTGAVAADHFDHVHVAFTGGGVAGQAVGGGANRAAQGDGLGSFAGLASRVWGAATGLMGSPGAMPSLVFTDQLGGGAYAHFNPANGRVAVTRAMLAAAQNPSDPNHNYALNALVHEFAHARQRSDVIMGDRRATEGGAELFASWASPQIMASLGIPYSGAFAHPYGAERSWVSKTKDRKWWQSGQFAHSGVAGVAGAAPRPGGGNAMAIARFLRSKGFTAPQVAGILGNLRQESGFNPGAVEGGGKGPGIGIAQWSFGRASALKKFAQSRGKSWKDLGVQLAFMMQEFQGSESGAYGAIKGAKTVKDAETAFGLKYERYGVMGNRSGSQYLGLARAAGKAGPGGGAAGPGSPAAAVAAKVNPFDQKMAGADLAIQQAQTAPATIKVGTGVGARKISSKLGQISALAGKRKLIGARIRSIRKALKGKLSPAKRLALTQELTTRLGEHAQLATDMAALRAPAAVGGDGGSIGDIGGAAGGGDFGAGDTADPNQALIDSNAALQAKIDEQIQADKEHTDALNAVRAEVKRQTDFATLVTNTSNYQLTKSLADLLSGQIVGYGVAGRKFTPGTGVEHAY